MHALGAWCVVTHVLLKSCPQHCPVSMVALSPASKHSQQHSALRAERDTAVSSNHNGAFWTRLVCNNTSNSTFCRDRLQHCHYNSSYSINPSRHSASFQTIMAAYKAAACTSIHPLIKHSSRQYTTNRWVRIPKEVSDKLLWVTVHDKPNKGQHCYAGPGSAAQHCLLGPAEPTCVSCTYKQCSVLGNSNGKCW